MAKKKNPSLLFLIIISVADHVIQSQGFHLKEETELWANNLEQEFDDITHSTNDITGASQYQKNYQNSMTSSIVIKSTNAKKIIEQLSKDMSTTFTYNIEALKNLQQKVEEEVRSYVFNTSLSLKTLKDNNYFNMNNDLNLDYFTYSSKFNQQIMTKNSGVHIPLEIYEGYPEIMNGIEMSGRIDDVFKENYKKYPDIYWQNFGSQEGYLRVYPAAIWKTVNNLPDLFDVRRRPWYIHGSVSPKDMIILLDTSGSMHGQSFDIMRLAAKTLINTLGENDFVNVASFSRNVSWVTPCLKTLVQANSRNKRLLFDGIDRLVDKDIASYNDALYFAFEAFIHFDKSKDEGGSDCHKLIMIFSDGCMVYPQEVINKYLNHSLTQNVRVFTYAVGPHPIPTVALKNMACATGGSFTTITAMGAIRTKIQSSYMNVIAKPEVLFQAHVLSFSSVYLDALNLGLVTTVTLPVFNTSRDSDNQTLAGVVGIDIPISKLLENFPRHHLGALGYSFALNENGFFVYHPELWRDVNYNDQHPAHIDFADIEGENKEFSFIRRSMIDGKEGSVTLTKEEIKLSYHFKQIQNSSFSLGIVVPKNWTYIEVREPQDIHLLTDIQKDKKAQIAPWNYCGHTRGEETLSSLLENIKSKGNNKCKDNFRLHHLLWDFKNTKLIFHSLLGKDSSNFSSRFVMTEGGLTLSHSLSSLIQDPYNSSLYKKGIQHSFSNDGRLLILNKKSFSQRLLPKFKVHGKDENIEILRNIHTEIPTSYMDNFEIFLLKSFSVQNQNQKFIAGIAGLQLTEQYLTEMLERASLHNCLSDSSLICNLVNPSGSILVSNQKDFQMGTFYGEVDPQMLHFINEKFEIFVIDKVSFNYQAMCPNALNCQGSGSQIISSLSLFLKSLMETFSVLKILVYSLMSSFFPQNTFGIKHELNNGVHRCQTKTTTWTFNSTLNSLKKFHDRLIDNCGNFECTRNVHIYKLGFPNAILIISDPKCSSCSTISYSLGPLEVDDMDNCQLPIRYRKRPKECFAVNEKEISECNTGSVAELKFSHIIYILIPLLLTILMKP